MIITQDRVPILGHAGLWQVLLEYEHAGRDSVQLTGFRLNSLGRHTADEDGSPEVPLEILLRNEGGRQLIYHHAEPLARWWNRERYLPSCVPIETGDLVQLRARFHFPIDLAHVVLF
jgi:hypothetical protein